MINDYKNIINDDSININKIYKGNTLIYYNGENALYHQSCPYRISDDKTTLSFLGIPEYNFHILFIPLNKQVDISKNSITYLSTSYYYSHDYINTTYQILKCDDDCYALCNAHAGSNGHAKNIPALMTANDGSVNTFNQNWYYGSAKWQIDGSYSSKIIHVPSNEYDTDIILNKYLCFLGNDISDWVESGRTQQGYTTAVDKIYYYSLVNEYQYWYSCDYTADNGYKNIKTEEYLLPTDIIIDNVTANNTTSLQNLHFHNKANTENKVKYQVLLYYQQSANSDLIGYQPNHYLKQILSGVRSPRFIFVQEPSDSKFIYWGYEPSVSQYSDYRVIVGKQYTDISLLETKIHYDFNNLSFATLDTIKKTMNNVLYDQESNPVIRYTAIFYVAVPTKYTNIPHAYDQSGKELSFADNLGYIPNGNSTCEFNGLQYKIYSFISTQQIYKLVLS